jgi:DNA-binding MarR family transcriptional regulator
MPDLRDRLADFEAAAQRLTRADFVADYELLRSEGYTRRQIAERLRMTYAGVAAAYRRAVAAGDLTPDRRTA